MLLLILVNSCGPGTITGNPIDPKKPGEDPDNSGTNIVLFTRTTQTSLIESFFGSIIAPAYAASSNIKFCFKRLRLKSDLGNAPEYDLNIGERLIDAYRTPLGNVNLPEGRYNRIEFDLEPNCAAGGSKPSVSLENDFGTFSTSSEVEIRFEGNFEVEKGKDLELNISPMLEALNTVQSNATIASKLENAVGSD